MQLQMLQEQEPVELPSNSPEPIPDHQSILSSYIIKLDQPRIQDHLIADYSAFRTKQAAQSLYKRTKDALSHSCAFALAVFKEAWREIVPSVVRGHIDNSALPEEEIDHDKDSVFFEEYRKKKAWFFLIIFDEKCNQEEMQEAYQKSSFIVTEGCGIRIGDLSKQTNCKQWKIEGWGKLKHYSILFFRFDVFGHLWNFGHLSKQLIEAYRDDEHFLDSFKSQLVDSFQCYESMERQFVSSFLEKEDRVYFQ